jgi:hypothetical protein
MFTSRLGFTLVECQIVTGDILIVQQIQKKNRSIKKLYEGKLFASRGVLCVSRWANTAEVWIVVSGRCELAITVGDVSGRLWTAMT